MNDQRPHTLHTYVMPGHLPFYTLLHRGRSVLAGVSNVPANGILVLHMCSKTYVLLPSRLASRKAIVLHVESCAGVAIYWAGRAKVMKHVHHIQWQENDVFGAVVLSFCHID